MRSTAMAAFLGLAAMAWPVLAAIEPDALARCTKAAAANDEALAACTKLLTPALSTDERVSVLVGRADIHRKMKKYKLAMQDLNEALGLAPDHVGLLNDRGNIHLDERRPEAAIVDYTRAIELRPNYAIAFQNRAIANFQLRRLDEAWRDSSEALLLRPNYARAYDMRGNILWARGDYAGALGEYDTSLKLDASLWETWRNRGNAYRDSNRLDLAIADYNAALERSPGNVAVQHARGTTELYAGAYAKAAEDFRVVAQDKGGNRYAVLFLGLATTRVGGDGKVEMLKLMPNGRPTTWLASLMHFTVGHIDLAAIQAAAKNDDPMVARERACDLAYVLGMQAMARNDRAEARKQFQAAMAGERTNLVCSQASRHELARLGAAPKAKTS